MLRDPASLVGELSRSQATCCLPLQWCMYCKLLLLGAAPSCFRQPKEAAGRANSSRTISPRLASSLQSFLLHSPCLVLAHHGEQLTQNEPRNCERSLAHTQGKRVALYSPCPRQNTHLEKGCCRPGCSLHHRLSRLQGIFCAHASVAALVVWRLGPPP